MKFALFCVGWLISHPFPFFGNHFFSTIRGFSPRCHDVTLYYTKEEEAISSSYTAPPPRLIFLCPISASSFIRGAYLRASLQSRFHKITLALSSKITSKWSFAEGYRGRERTDWNSYCVCTRVCVWTCVRKSDYFSRMTDQNDRKRRQRENKRQSSRKV